MADPTRPDVVPDEIIPHFQNYQYTDKDGQLTATAQLFMSQFNQIILSLIGRYGFQVPNLTTDQINWVSAFTPNGIATDGINNTGLPVGTLWFNTDLGKLQVKTALTPLPTGTIETLASAVEGVNFLTTQDP